MFVQVQPVQIPKVWELVKHACVKSDGIKQKHLAEYCLTLLQDLLSNKKICFLTGENDQVGLVIVVSFRVNELTGIKYLYIGNIYSHGHSTKERWQEAFDNVRKVAKLSDCEAIGVSTTNPRAIEIAKLLGFELFNSLYYRYL